MVELEATKFACVFVVQAAIMQHRLDFRDAQCAGRSSGAEASVDVPSTNIAQTMEAAAAAVPATGAEEDDNLETMTVAEPEMEVEGQPSEG